MGKDDKVINLFDNLPDGQGENVKYSELLNEFIKPFEHRFPMDYDMVEVIEFGINAWNMGNMKLIVPDQEFRDIIAESPLQNPEKTIFKQMLRKKENNFKRYDRFIMDYDLVETADKPTLTVITKEKEAAVTELMESMADIPELANFEDGYINRRSITLSPKKPFFDWLNKIYPEDPVYEVEEVNTYLVGEDGDDVQQWLQDNFRIIFTKELEFWHIEEKDWPLKRNYGMFTDWFDFFLSDMVYDLENYPVEKWL